jgi:hypothetical protein
MPACKPFPGRRNGRVRETFLKTKVENLARSPRIAGRIRS